MQKWSLYRAGALCFHCWDDGAVVFDRFSGDTHHVGPLAIELLLSLERIPEMSLQALLDDFDDVFSDIQNGLTVIKEALLQLEALGLVKRIPV